MNKFLLASSAVIALASTSAMAQQANPDPGANNPSLYTTYGVSPQPTVSGGTINFTGASKMTLITIPAPTVKKGKEYKIEWDQSNRTQGSSVILLSRLMMGVATGANVTAPSLAGETAIADNFPSANSLVSVPPVVSDGPKNPTCTEGALPDTCITMISAFRTFASYSHSGADDCIVYFGQPGTSHLHAFLANTKTDAYCTYNKLRTTGSTTAGNLGQPKAPANRTGGWHPTMLDDDGNEYTPIGINYYYKIPWKGSKYCDSYPHVPEAECVDNAIPNGLRYVFGFDFASNSMPATAFVNWTGLTEHTGPGALDAAIDEVVAAGKNTIVLKMLAYNCWDGIHLDTPNHRSHMSDMVTPGPGHYYNCPSAYPKRVAEISWQIFYHLYPKFKQHKVHLSSDEMAGSGSGTTAHMDYFEAWSPSEKARWANALVYRNLSLGDGDNGDGTAIRDAGLLTQPIPIDGNLDTQAEAGVPLPIVRSQRNGRSKPCRINGHCVDYVTAAASGMIQIMSYDALIGKVDNVTVTPAR